MLKIKSVEWKVKDEKETQEEDNKKTMKNIFVKNTSINSRNNSKEKGENKKVENEKEKILKVFKGSPSNFLEEFEVLDQIGKGGSGTVYEGRIKKSCKNVALKIFIDLKECLDEKRKKEEKRQKFKEAAFLKDLHHRNIIPIYGHVKINEESSCLVLEMGKYGDINNFKNKLLKKKRLSESLICFLTKGILEALRFCHKSKIAHMDIKEGNIIIDELLNPKLTDFSVSFSYSKVKENEKIKLPFVGTSVYISPEVIREDRIEIDEINKVDTYSLGILIYHLAYNKFPYSLTKEDRNDYKNIERKIKKEQLIFPKDENYSPLFQGFVSGLLEKKIKNRFSIEDALNHPFMKYSEILYDEKEKYCDLQNFLIALLCDGITQFNKNIKK